MAKILLTILLCIVAIVPAAIVGGIIGDMVGLFFEMPGGSATGNVVRALTFTPFAWIAIVIGIIYCLYGRGEDAGQEGQ